jgi:hypothetical protein
MADMQGLLRHDCFVPILLQKSGARDRVVWRFVRNGDLNAAGLDAQLQRSRCTELLPVAVAQPVTRAASGSERWQLKQTRPGRLVDHAVEVDRA